MTLHIKHSLNGPVSHRGAIESRGGQALVVLLFFMIIAITLSTTAVAVMVSNSLSVTRSELSARAIELAEGGAQNALVRLIRMTTYTGETMNLGDGTATITVSGTNPKIIQSVGTIGEVSRIIQVVVTTTNGISTITSWTEL
jgi:hypothetical protein